MTIVHVIGILATIALIMGVGYLSGRNVKDSKSFTTGGTNGGWTVCGAILGTLISGQATVGSAQLAFAYGISAWWFTLGAAFGCVLLALAYLKPLRSSGCSTLLEVVNREYGAKAETVGSLLCFIGIFISIIAQIIASSAMITSLFGMRFIWAALIAIVLMATYVVFGGIKGAGIGGIVKLVLLYISAIVSGIVVLKLGDGFGGIMGSVKAQLNNSTMLDMNMLTGMDDVDHRYKSFFARGPLNDLGSCISLMLGVIATQTYAQAVWSAKSNKEARKGSLLSALLIPPIGAACVMVGIYMRGHYVTEAEVEALTTAGMAIPEGVGVLQNSAQAFPTFVLNHLPAWLGGIVLGTLLVTVIGGGSGLSLGAATILVRDVFSNFNKKVMNNLWVMRGTILGILILGVVSSAMFDGAFINDLGFLSLGLRATAVLIPLSLALWAPGKFKSGFALASMIGGTAMMLAAKFLALPADPVFWGLGVGLLIIAFGRKK